MSFMYYGGKSRIAKEIIEFFPKHHTYVEVFGGSGEILFRKKPSKTEIWNDLDEGLYAIFKCLLSSELKNQLIELLEQIPPIRTLFNDLQELLIDTQDYPKIVLQAFRKLYLLRYSFNANCKDFSYMQNRTTGRMKPNCITPLNFLYEEISKRKIVFENLDFEKIIKRFDLTGVLFYIDPPYYAVPSGYEVSFSEEDHQRLLAVIRQIKNAVWFLSYNKNPEIKHWYSQSYFVDFEVRYAHHNFQLQGSSNEYLISNRPFHQHGYYSNYDLLLESFLGRDNSEEGEEQ